MQWLKAHRRINRNLELVLLIIAGVALLAGALIDFQSDYTYAGLGVSITRNYQNASNDSYANEASKSSNYGTATTFSVQSGSGSAKNMRGLVQLNISEIPTGSTGISSTLQLYLSTAPSGSTRTHDAHRITPTWAEGTVTWNNQPTYNGTATASTATGTTSGVWLSWTVTNDVSAYVGGTAPNYGWLVKDQLEGSGTTYTGIYASKENGTPTNRPKISVTFTAPWDSYSDSPPSTICDSFSNGTNHVYMKGTGFPNGSYNVGYYDAVGDGVATANPSVTGGTLLSDYSLTTDPGAAGNGNWHVLVQPASGYQGFGADTYSTITASPNTYGLVANDAFYVANTAIPEFPTVMAGIMVAGLCFGIYWWMRKGAKFKMQSAKL